LAAIYSQAYPVVTSISVIGLYVSYVIPVYLALRAGRKAIGDRRGPWHLGRYSRAVNLVAIVWVAFISVILSLPDNMRAGKAIVALALLLGFLYVLRERKRFLGPAFLADREGEIIRTIESTEALPSKAEGD